MAPISCTKLTMRRAPTLKQATRCVSIALLSLLVLQLQTSCVLARAQPPQDISATTTNASSTNARPPSQTLADRQAQPTQPGADDEYLIGLGIADITGPSADINLVSVLSQLAEMAADLLVAPASQARSLDLPPPPPSRSRILSRPKMSTNQKLASNLPLANPIKPRKLIADKAACGIQGWRWPIVACKCNNKSNTTSERALHRKLRKRRYMATGEERQATISLDDRPLLNLAYPSWRDLQNFKLQMGYAKPNQDAGGIHLRQFSRALVVEDKLGARLLYVNLDNGMISQLLRTRVLRRLQEDFGAHTYNASNVMLSATHTHSCPGGFFQYMLYNIPSAGFISQTLEALVDGIARSVARAQASLQPGRIYVSRGELLDASVNRSPTSYANNPAEERAQYAHDTDKTMTMLRLVDSRGAPLGMLNWFAVHGTSMNNSNHLISSDNKGYAALLMEQEFELMRQAQVAASQKEGGQQQGHQTTSSKFVAIFAQANEGDVSPNTRGPRCVDSGLPCDDASSTCGSPPRNEKCIAFGPGRDMFESTKIIAYKQYYKARQLFLNEANQRQVRGPIRYVHEHIDMTRQQVPAYDSLVQQLQKRASIADLAAQQKQQFLQPNSRSRRRQDKRQAQDGVPIMLNNNTTISNTNNLNVNSTYETCLPALGYSFAAGTTDGPGAFDFQQGDTASTRYWNMVRDFLRRPSPAQMKCHHPKPILLATGEMDFPYMWHPKVVPTQIFMIGQVAIVGLPGEFTTMSGRRVRAAVKQALEKRADFSSYPVEHSSDGFLVDLNDDDHETDDDDFGDEPPTKRPSGGSSTSSDLLSDEAQNKRRQQIRASRRSRRTKQLNNRSAQEVEVVLSGLSNIYTSYITTIEEYEMQRYEGASTLYGPHTLQAYVNQFRRLASLLASSKTSGNVPLDDSLQPPDLTKSLFTLKPGVVYDGAPHGKNFGDLLQDVDTKRVFKCRELVSASFVAGNPRNDLKQEQSFLYVDLFEPNSRSWTPVASDASWDTKFIWERTNTLFGESKATVQWDIPDSCQSGIYRLRHLGAHKSLMQKVSQYAGKSAPFKVLGGQLAHDNGNQTTSNEQLNHLEQLEQLRQLAEQVEALEAAASEQAAQQEGAAASQPKSDVAANEAGERHLTSLLLAPLKYLSSLAFRKW